MNILHFVLNEKIAESVNSTIFKSFDEKLKKNVILKINKKSKDENIHNLKNEYEIISKFEHRNVIKTNEFLDDEDQQIMSLEDINGLSVKSLIRNKTFIITDFFIIASELLDAVSHIHSKNYLHLDLTSANVIWSEEQKLLKVIDFNLSKEIDKIQSEQHSENIQGTLSYISPEQTGRVKNKIDKRSDLYSIGIIFYEILTGKLPFEAENIIDLLYKHIAVQATPINELNPDIPQKINEFVQKLIAKNPNDRYQSADSALHDIQLIHKQISKNENLDFELGLTDNLAKVIKPQQIYAKNTEFELVKQFYENSDNFQNRFILISGESGSGKTFFIEKINQWQTQNNKINYTINCVYNSEQTTYSTIRLFIYKLIDYIFINLKSELENLKLSVIQAVENNGFVLTNIFPAIKKLIGEQNEILTLDGLKEKERFIYTFKNFIFTIFSYFKNLNITFDNAQFIDKHSLEIIKEIVNEYKGANMIVVLAFRKNFKSQILDLISNENSLNIEFDKVTTSDFHNFLCEALSVNSENNNLINLSDVIYSKTDGNFLYSFNFIENLFEDKKLVYNIKTQNWEFDIEYIKSIQVSNNLISIIKEEIFKIGEKLKIILKIGACIGETFDIELLAQIYNKPIDEIKEELFKAISKKIIFSVDLQNLKFTHYDIYNYFYNEETVEQNPKIHFEIGNKVLNNPEVSLFNKLEHFNIAINLITSDSLKKQVSELNFEAGKKSLSLLSFEKAFVYFENSISLLPTNSWTENYNDTLAKFTNCANSAYLIENYEKAEILIDEILKHKKDYADCIEAILIKLKIYITQTQYKQAIDYGIEQLRTLGVNKRKLPINIATVVELAQNAKYIIGKNDLKFLDELNNKNPKLNLILEIISVLSTAIIHSGSEYFGYFAIQPLNLIFKNKTSFYATPFWISIYGMILTYTFKKHEKGIKYALYSQKMLKNSMHQNIEIKADFIFYHMINHLINPIESAIEPINENYKKSLQVGDKEYAANYKLLTSYYNFWSGKNFDYSLPILQESDKIIEAINFPTWTFCNKMLHQFVVMLNDKEIPTSAKFTGEIYNEDKYLPIHLKDNDFTSVDTLYYLKLMHNVIFNKYKEAAEDGKIAIKHQGSLYGSPTIPLIIMYNAIALIQIYDEETGKEKSNCLKEIKKTLTEFKKLSEINPVNYKHKYYLLLALYHEKIKKSEKEDYYYSEAINLSKTNIINERALIYEYSAKYNLNKNKKDIAEMYFTKAANLYKAWGAISKSNQLTEKFPNFVRNIRAAANINNSITQSDSLSNSGLDIENVLKTSQMISEELKLANIKNNLSINLMKITGAQKIVLISLDNNILNVILNIELIANSEIIKNETTGENLYPEYLISEVLRKNKTLIFDNISKETNYEHDKYINNRQPKSIICLPLKYKQQVKGIIYLENNSLEGAFTKGRIETINLLSTQLAISIENSQLFEDLELKVEQRTEKLQQANIVLNTQKIEIDKLYHDINSSITYASRIQKTIMSDIKTLEEYLKDYFIIFKPKDVVSGDFYWFKKYNDYLLIVAADCTGHGIPGAFMSMIGISLIENTIINKDINSASQTLEYLRIGIKNMLKQSNDKSINDDGYASKDGMDIAFCAINLKTNEMQYAGAYNPLYIVRNGELEEIKATRSPIGVHLVEKNFENNQFIIQPNDRFYIFSDGFVDQVASDNTSKIKSKKFKELLINTSNQDFKTQKLNIENFFDTWKGPKTKQVDDVLVIGFECKELLN